MENKYGGLYQNYWEKIKDDVVKVKTDYDYPNLGIAFGHWFLVVIESYTDEEASSSIVDGNGDWGMDAIISDPNNGLIKIFQFKFPEKGDNINKKIDQTAVNALFRGYSFISNGAIPEGANDGLISKLKEIYADENYKFELNFVSYGSGISSQGQTIINQELKKIEETGNNLDVITTTKENIMDNFMDKRKDADTVHIELEPTTNTPMFEETEETKSYTIFTSIEDLADIALKHGTSIFNENVRLFYGVDNKNNKKIIETATSEEQSQYFHLYNNGITIIADEVQHLTQRQIIKIVNPSIINGCQTMSSLGEAKKTGEIKTGMAKVTVIQSNNERIKNNISIYSNSQTEIRDSFLVSNRPEIIALEPMIQEKGFIFERQANKVKNLKSSLTRQEKSDIFGIANSKVITLENGVQTYTAFFLNKHTSIAKSNKNKLFDKAILDEILSEVDAEKMILADQLYKKITLIIKQYRSYRRNNSKKEFIEYLSIKESEINFYSFINTGDIFLLSGMGILSLEKFKKIKKPTMTYLEYVETNFDLFFKQAIITMKHTLLVNNIEQDSYSVQTKNASFFNKYKEELYKFSSN